MLTSLLTIFFITFIADLTPGPNFWKIVHHSVASGRRASLTFTLGLLTASSVHCALGVVGVSALIAQWDTALLIVQWVGGAYIAFYGVQLMLGRTQHADPDPDDVTSAAPRRAVRLWADGVLTNFSNPKTILFYASLFTVVLEPTRSAMYLGVAMLGLLATSGLTNASVACAFSLGRVRRGFARWERWLSRAIGGLLVLGGLKIALQGRG